MPANTARVTYKHDRLEEVVCHLSVALPQRWTHTLYGELYAAARPLGYTEAENLQPVSAENLQVPVVRLRNPDTNTVMQLGPQMFTCNQLKPYCGWPEFKQRATQAAHLFYEVVKPAGIHTLALQYVNRFTLPEDDQALDTWFTIVPTTPELPGSKSAVFLMHERALDGDQKLVIKLGDAQSEDPSEVSIILEIIHQVSFPQPWDAWELSNAMEIVHQGAYDTFERCITQQTRSLLG